jgi:acetylglutamate kinase
MYPKVSAGLYCVKNGVESAQIINGTDPHSVIAELFTDQGIGTKIVFE